VANYRLDAAFGTLHMQQLHGFDELLNDQGIILSCTAKLNTATVSLYFSASYFSSHFLRLAKMEERVENG
jgi:hypothetical protein